MEYYSAVKNEILPHAMTRMNLFFFRIHNLFNHNFNFIKKYVYTHIEGPWWLIQKEKKEVSIC